MNNKVRIFINVLLFFGIISFVAEFYFNFKEVKISFYSLNFDKYFKEEIFFYKDQFTSIASRTNSNSIYVYGNIPNKKNKYQIKLSEYQFNEFMKFDKNNNRYYIVWYNEELDFVFLKTKKNKGKIIYNGFFFFAFWLSCTILIIKKIINEKK